MKLIINIENRIKSSIPSKEDIIDAIADVLKEKDLDGAFEIDIKIVDKDEIHELNKKYRSKDAPTDVLSFPIHDKVTSDIANPILLGDIILCPEMAIDSIIDLIKHSTLHLLGFHHKGDE